jgi:hypothetical protein
VWVKAKRWPSMLCLLAAAALALGACGDDESSGDAAKPAATAEAPADASGIAAAKAFVAKYAEGAGLEVAPLAKKPKPGVTIGQVNCGIPDCQPGALAKAASEFGWKVQEHEFDLTKGPQDFVAQLKAAIASKPDYIVSTATFGDKLALPLYGQAEKQGIKVIHVAGTNADGVEAMVQGVPTFEIIGRLQADVALADAGGKTTVGVAYDPTVGAVVKTSDAIVSEPEKNGDGTTVKKLKLSVAKTPQQNSAAINSFLLKNQDIKYLIFQTPGIAVGVFPPLKSSGLLAKVKVILNYPNTSILEPIRDGDVFATVAGESDFNWRVIDTIARIQNGEKYDKLPIGTFRVIQGKADDLGQANPPDYENVYEQAWGTGA